MVSTVLALLQACGCPCLTVGLHHVVLQCSRVCSVALLCCQTKRDGVPVAIC